MKSASGEKMGGVTVFTKIEGTPVTGVCLLPMKQGNYYFPPHDRTASTKVWAQAVGFEAVRGES